MLVIGLTGGIGSGKTTVAKLFAEIGVPIIDTDELARTVTQLNHPALQKIEEFFGKEILLPDGSLNRSKLRKKIMSDPSARIWLEQLLHPLIRDEMQKLIKNLQTDYCIAVIPLLLETAPNPLIHRILVVDTPVELQIKRTEARDQHTTEEVEAILKVQISREKRLQKADDIIHNEGNLRDLHPQVEALHQFYTNLSKKCL